MSLQAGTWNLDGNPIDPELLRRLGQSSHEHELDTQATYVNGTLGMVYRPFHTTVEARLESQPHHGATGRVLTWDGRIDNRSELISRLSEYLSDDHTDVAIVAAAFDCWGTDCFATLRGDWAAAIWEGREKTLILARDYIGIRHLYWYPTAKTITWCSDLGCLAGLAGQLTLCDEYIAGYFATRLQAHLTPFLEIQAVPPGSFIRIEGGTVRISAYWTFNPRFRTLHKTDQEYEEHFCRLFRQAVLRRLRSSSPVLADLSGGYDSSSIVCMADALAREDVEQCRVDTFSYTFPDEPDGDDSVFFPRVEEQRGQIGQHAEITGTGDSLWLGDGTFVGFPVVGARIEVEAAQSAVMRKGNYRIRLSGFGGDELVGQALDPRVHMADLLVQLRFRELARQLEQWSLLIRCPWIQLLFQTTLLLMPLSIRSRLTQIAKLDKWIDPGFAREYRLSELLLQAAKGPWSWRPGARDAFQTYATLSGILTNLSPTFYETRYPYLDQDLVEFLMSVPTDQLLRPGERRSLMRRSLVNLLPKGILSRRTKQIEGRCYMVTLAKHWDHILAIFASPVSSRLGYIRESNFKQALLRFKEGNLSTDSQLLLRGLALEFWLRAAAERGVIAVAPPKRAIKADLFPSNLSDRPSNRGCETSGQT